VGHVPGDAYKRTRLRVPIDGYTPAQSPHTRTKDNIVYKRDIHVWTDSSVENNSTDACTVGSAWVSDLHFEDKVMLSGSMLSNNVAEVAVAVLCLLAWSDTHLVIHTDSTFVLGLVGGGLLAMERDGWGDAPRHTSRGPPTPLLQYLLYLMRDRSGRLRFEKAKAHGEDNMNNLADRLANEGQVSGRIFDIGSITIPGGWIDTAPVLCHQPLDYLTKLVVRARVRAPTSTLKFESFSDRWTVLLGNMFGVMLDPGNHVSKVWSLTILEGLKEVLWKEMNGAQVIGHRYYGTRMMKLDMGRSCLCSNEMSLGHILLGCDAYQLQPLMDELTTVLGSISPALGFKTLHPDAWGSSPWYPLLALKALEELAFPIVKGRKKSLKALEKTRQCREWVIGNYYWALWKWRMKEIHNAKFSFVPLRCVEHLRKVLLTPIPAHLLRVPVDGDDAHDATGPTAVPALGPKPMGLVGDLTKLPQPVSHILAQDAVARLSEKGKSILHAIKAHLLLSATRTLTSRDRILRALTDDTYA